MKFTKGHSARQEFWFWTAHNLFWILPKPLPHLKYLKDLEWLFYPVRQDQVWQLVLAHFVSGRAGNVGLGLMKGFKAKWPVDTLLRVEGEATGHVLLCESELGNVKTPLSRGEGVDEKAATVK